MRIGRHEKGNKRLFHQQHCAACSVALLTVTLIIKCAKLKVVNQTVINQLFDGVRSRERERNDERDTGGTSD